MLDGIIILETVKNKSNISGSLWFLFIILIVLLLIAAVVTCFMMKVGFTGRFEAKFFLPFMIASLFFALLVNCAKLADINGACILSEYEIAYKCIVNESISATELLQHYEILDKDGDVYILKPLRDN